MTMDVRIQVQGLGVLVTLETVDVTPGQCQGGWLSLENVDVSLHTGCGEDCHPGDWTCNPTYRVWEHGQSRD